MTDDEALALWRRWGPAMIKEQHPEAWQRMCLWRMRYKFGAPETAKRVERYLSRALLPERTKGRRRSFDSLVVDEFIKLLICDDDYAAYREQFGDNADALFRDIESKITNRDEIFVEFETEIAGSATKGIGLIGSGGRPGAAVRARVERLCAEIPDGGDGEEQQ